MENDKIKFSELYENFTGSGNINGKYWIFGLESGGEVDWCQENGVKDELVINFIKNNKKEVFRILSNFDEEIQTSSTFHNIICMLLKILNEYENNVMSGNFNYSTVYRTNICPLVFPSDCESIFREYMKCDRYKKFIEFDEDNTKSKSTFYRKLLEERANFLANRDLSKVKAIFFISKNWTEYFIKYFLNIVFNTNYTHLKKEDKIDLYVSGDNPKLIVLPQRGLGYDNLSNFIKNI